MLPFCKEILFDIVAHGNNVEATFDFVERTVRLVAFDCSVASTLLLVWTKFKRKSCMAKPMTPAQCPHFARESIVQLIAHRSPLTQRRIGELGFHLACYFHGKHCFIAVSCKVMQQLTVALPH